MRVLYFDSIRATAICLVVFIHSWDTAFRSPDITNTALAWINHQTFHTIGRYAVPLFVMLTGALVLTRSIPDIWSFLKSKLPKFIGIIVVTSIVYGIYAAQFMGMEIKDVPKSIVDGNPMAAYHLWYMYMLVGLYASLPFLSRMLGHMNENEVRMAIAIGFFFVLLPWTLSMLRTGLHYPVAGAYFLQTYGIYAVTGFWLVRYDGLKTWGIFKRLTLLAITLALTVTVKFIREFDPANIQFPDGITWYDSAFIYLSAVLMFTLFRDIKLNTPRLASVVKYISRISLSIYLWHLLGIYNIQQFTGHLALSPSTQFILFMITGSVFGMAFFKLLYRTKFSWLVA